MALFQGNVRSQALRMDTQLQVFMPSEETLAPKDGKLKTVILLHGLKQNADSWVRMSRVVRFAVLTGFCVIIPEAQRSWYVNMAGGLKYFDYVAKELPELCGKMFRLPLERDCLYAAGLSMGGYGALKCALACPDRFAGAMSYSGALYCVEEPLYLQQEVPLEEMRGVIGQELRCQAGDSLDTLARQAAEGGRRPWLYVACGTEDVLLPYSRRFTNLARGLGFSVVQEEWSGGHTWAFWDRACGRSFALAAGMDPDWVLENA